MKLKRPDHDEWRPDGWTLYARLTLWRRVSGQEHTSSKRLQLFSHIRVLERNLIASRTMNCVRTCCWDVWTDATWNSSKLLNIEDGLDGKFLSFGRMMLWTVEHPDEISHHPDRCKGSDFSNLESVQNLQEAYLWKYWALI
jgi:hypothetical protein